MPPQAKFETILPNKSWLFLILVVGFVFVKVVHSIFTCRTKHLPGPWISRFTHYRLKGAVISGQRTVYIDELHKKYGPIVRISPTEVSVSDMEAFKQIHKFGTTFLKSNWYEKLVGLPKQNVFSMTDPREHAQRRKLLSRPFSKTYLVEHWEDVVREKVLLCVEKIRDDATRDVADVFNWWMLLASDVSSHLAFGESFGMLQNGRANQWIRVLKQIVAGVGLMIELPILRLLKFVPIAKFQETFNGNAYIIKGANRAVEMARASTGETNIFSKVLEDSEKEGEGHVDDIDVKVEAVSIIVAGTDTTGVSLTYLIWAILQRPGLQAALEAEVAQLPQDFKESDLLNNKLINAVIEVTLRLYGAAPGSLPRVVPAGGYKLCGYYIPGGVTVCTQAYTIHRDPKIWSDPLTFNPGRWIGGDDAPAEAHSADARAAFHPFGAGSRTCLGIHLARMELRYAVAFFFRECRGIRLGERTTPESMEFENFFLIAPKAHRCEVTFKK